MKYCKCGKKLREGQRKYCSEECAKKAHLANMAAWRKKNPDNLKNWKEEHKEEQKEYMREYMKEYLQDEEHKLKHDELVKKNRMEKRKVNNGEISEQSQ